MIFLVLTLLLQQNDEKCALGENTATSIQYFSRCLDSIPFNEEVKNQTLGTLKNLMKIFVFKEQAKQNNVFNLTPVDVDKELDALEKQNFTSDFHFHMAVRDIFQNLHDAHTKYILPQGYASFSICNGVQIVYKNNKYYLQPVNSTIAQQVLKYYNYSTKEEKELKSIDGNENISQYLQEEANNVSFSVREQNAKFNDYLQNSFHKRGFNSYGSFKINQTFKFKFVDDEEIELGYMIYSSKTINSIQAIVELNKAKNDTNQTPMQRFLMENEKIEQQLKLNSNTSELLYNGTDIKLYICNTSKGFIYVLSVPTYSPKNVSIFVDDYVAAMNILKTKQKGKLIINIAGNGGGYITLGYRMLASLYPYLEPRWGNYSIVKTPLNQFFVESDAKANTFSTQERFNLVTRKVYKNAEWYLNESTTNYNTTFSGKYAFDLAYDELPRDVYDKLLNAQIPDWFNNSDNDNLIFVTDGKCGSTCACFAMRGAEGNVGLYLQLGGNPDSKQNVIVASFAGGSVMDTDYTNLFNLTMYNITKFPTSALLRWAHEQVFSWNNENETLEFKYIPTNDKLPVYFDGVNGWQSQIKIEEVAEQVVQLLAKQECYDFMHKQNNCSANVSHILGNKCKDGKYQNNCVLVACGIGYQMSNGACIVVPKKSSNPEEEEELPKKDDNTKNIIIITCSCIGVVALIVIITIMVFCIIKKRKENEQHEKQKLIVEEYTS